MTRINLGIRPSELCDQMLVAEYHELPRTVKLFAERYDRMGDSAYEVGVPIHPTLGTGHVLYFINYGGELRSRYSAICDEMRYRGIHVGYDGPLEYATPYIVPGHHLTAGRNMLIDRIKVRLSEMKRTPVWTNRIPPTWAGAIR